MEIQPLSSGSKGNMTWIGSSGGALLIDAGLSAKRCEERLIDAGKDIHQVRAILLTHEHYDHIQGVRILAKRHHIPVYLNQITADAAILKGYLEDVELHILQNGRNFQLGEFTIHPFTVSHDAADTINYTIKCKDFAFGIFTDLGFVSSLVKQKAQLLDAMILEANHDLELLKASSYPLELKRRIRSRQGHLSNSESLDLLEESLSAGRLKKVWFAHLSEENNDHVLLKEQYDQRIAATSLQMEIAQQHKVSAPFLIQ